MNEKDFKKWAGSENIKKAEEYRKNTYGLTDEGSKSYRELKAKANNMSLSKKETGGVSVSGNNPSMLGRAGLIARGSARQTFGGINTSGAIASTYLGRAMDRTMDSLGLGKDTENNQKILNELKASYEKANDKQKAMLEPTIKYYEAKVAGTEKQYAEQWHRNQIAEAQKMTEKGSQDIEKAKQGLGAVGQFAVDVGAGAAQLGMSALAGYGSALAPMMISAAGNSAGEALNEGATLNQATAYGALSGAIEGATEKLFSFGKPFKSLVGKGLGDEAVENLARRATFNFIKSASGRELANGLVRTGLAATTEGAEEMISSLVNPWLKNLTYTDGEKVDVREVLYSGLVGSAVGGLLGGAGQISESRNYSKVGKAMRDLDATESVIQTGLDSNPDTDSYVFANRIRDIQSRGGEISNQDIGRLYKANRDTIKAEEEAKKKQGDRTYIVDGILQNAEKTSSGQAQSSTMGTGSTTRISDAVRSLGDNGAKALGQFYKGETDFDSYYAGFSRYYEAGVSNVPFEKINTEYAKNISEAVKYAAYSAGQNDAKISLKQEIKDSKFAKVYGKEGGLILDDVAKSLKPRLQETLNTVAKVSGTKIKIVESISTGDSEAGANGYYKSSEGIIYIAKDADNPLFVVAKHEITHHMQKVAPKEYRAYRDYVMSVISDGQAVDTIVEQKRAQYASAGQNLSVEEAMDEIVADYTEQIIKDEKVLNEFISKGEKSVVQKFFDSVREFINRVKKAFKGDKTKMDAAAEETYGATISELERAEQLWLDALKATKKKAEKNNHDIREQFLDETDDTKYSINESFALEIGKWNHNGRKNGETFVLGSTGDILQGLGAIESDIYMKSDKINQIIAEHQEMDVETIKKIPQILEKPVLVLKSKGVGRGKRANTRLVIFGTVKATNGKPVLTVLDLRPIEGNLVVEDMQKINSAYTKETDPVNFVRESFVLYADKKRTAQLLRTIGFQMPIELQRSGFIGKISYFNQKVNVDGEKFSTVVYEGQPVLTVKDSTGRKLTNQQAEYFKDSKVRDENPTADSDIRFSMKKPVEETKNLIAVHNVYMNKLEDALKLGGLPAPSIAITKSDIPHENFGEVSLVFRKESISPTDRRNKIYSGDAWTPTRVRVEYDVDDDVVEKFNNKIRELTPKWGNESLPSVDAGTANIEDDSLSESYKRSVRARYAFLKEKGKAPRVVMRTPQQSTFVSNDTLIKIAKAFTGNQLKSIANTSEGYEQYKNAILKIIRDSENSIAEEYTNPKIKEIQLKKNAEKYSAENVSRSRIEDAARIAGYIKKDKYTIVKEIDKYATEDGIKKKFTSKLEAEFKAWVDENTKGAIRNKGIRNNKDLFTPSGNRRSFKELHDPYTLSNIVKNMFADAEKGIGAFGGSPIGTAQREYGSIEDVKADSDRLRLINDDEYKEIEREIYDDTTALANRMVINSDVFAVRDLLAEAIAKPTKKQADSYLRREAKGWAKYSPGIADELWDIKKRINNMPTGYFEAKPQRAVGFEEVVLAVIPKGKKELKKQLEDAGVQKVRYYDTKVEGDRLEKINKAPDVLFSLKGQSDLQKENAKLKEYNEYLKEQMKLTKDIKQDKKAMEKLSKGILKDYSSEMDSAELLRQLNEVYSYIANSDSLSWDELKPMARRVAGNILSQSVAIVDEAYQLYKDLITGLSRTRINLSKDYRNGLKGGYEEFRKANLGKFRLVNSGGRNVDVLYNELADTYPELFDAEKYTHPVDQLEHIAEVLDGLKPVEENPYSYDMRNATEWLANEIIDRYFEVPQAKKTFADKQADKLTKEKIKGAEKLANQKERYENKIADIKLHSKQRIAEAVKREKAAKWDKVAQVKQAQREKESRLSDRRKRSMYVNKIRKHAAKISKMLLNPTETSHVPEPLRKPVAEFLSLFDMTSDGMEEKSIQKFQSLREAYLKIADSADATLMDIDPDLDANLEQIIEAFKGNGDLRISNMSAKDTETLYRAVMAVERSIYSYNKLMNDEKQTTIADYGESAMEELATKHPFREKRGVARVVGDTLNMDMVAPAEFFDELGGTMKSLYDDIRKGFDKKISNLEIARAYMEKLTKGIALKEITGNKARTTSFELSGGKIELTKAQVMSLYLLNKQPDAQEHIYTGGIKAAPIVARGEKGRRARIQKSFEVIKVTPEDIDEIIGSMSKEEKALADGIGKFFTDYTAEWGNEVSEKLYGYRKFTVENYFPIVSDKNYINQVFGETTDVTLKNMGSTKSRIKGANNPIIIEDVIDVFTRQVDSMASYNAFVIPLNDIQKVYNYKNINGSVKQSIEKKFGVRANKYFSTFITDMNGGGKFDGGTGTFNFMLGKYKQAKMGLNLRIVLQQPTSYLRAAAVINPKYLTKAAASPKKVDYNLVMKYAPIARWKDWGHFSLDTSKSMKSIIMEKKEMSDYTMALAKQADRLTWGRLWKAAEYEIQDKHPELRKGSEEYYQAVGERFSEIIDKTQVVDSTLHRPQIMRRKDGLTRMTMSFMSETMRSYNLLRTALRNAKVNPGKVAAKLAFAAVTAYMTQVIVNHIITGFVDTLRGDDDDQFFIDKLMGLFDGDDDDDDETTLTFEQRWIKHFVDNLINEPLSMFPAVKDVWSIVQGFSVERMDMASIGDLLSAVKRTFSDKYTPIFKMADVGSKVLDMFGVPASSFKREVATGAKLALGVSGNPVMEYKANKYLYNVKSNKKMYMDLLYKTMKSGDMESYYAIVEDMVNSGVPGSEIESAMRSRAKKDSEMGTDISNFDSTLAGIGIKYQNPEEKKEDDKFKVEDLDGAGYAEYSSIKQDILNQLISDFKARGFGDLDEETANDILSAAYAYSESIALQEASDGAYKEETQWINLAETSLEDLGISIAEYIELKEEYGDSSLRAKGTYKAAEMGIDLDKYLEASEFKYDAKADYYTDSNGNPVLDKNGNKKTIPYSKQNKVKAYMNGMDLTEEEYEMIWDILYP